jgi:sirohydrochlorin ferrochelatase
LQAIKSTSEGQAPTHPGLRRATPETIDDVLDLHRRVAELESG